MMLVFFEFCFDSVVKVSKDQWKKCKSTATLSQQRLAVFV